MGVPIGEIVVRCGLALPWVIGLGAVMAAVVVWSVMRRREQSVAWRMLRGGIRLALAAVMLAMFADPSILCFRTDRPLLVVVEDDSASMADTASADAVGRWTAELERRYRVRRVRTSDFFGRDESPIGDAILDVLGGMPDGRGESETGVGGGERSDVPAAVVTFSDGLVTHGATLPTAAELAQRRGVPLFFVGFSNTVPDPPQLTGLVATDPVRTGETVRFAATLTGGMTLGSDPAIPVGGDYTIRLVRRDTGETLAERTVTMPDAGADDPAGSVADGGIPVRMTWRPTVPGDVECEMRIVRGAVPGDGNEESESSDHAVRTVVHVRDEPIRVLMIQDEPSYEYRFLRNLLLRDQMIGLDVLLQSADADAPDQDPTLLRDFPTAERLAEYDIVILGDVDRRRLGDAAMEATVGWVREVLPQRALFVLPGPRHPYTTSPESTQPGEMSLAGILPVQVGGLRAEPAGGQLRLTAIGAMHAALAGVVPEENENGDSGLAWLGEADASGERIFSDATRPDWALMATKWSPGAVVLVEMTPDSTENRTTPDTICNAASGGPERGGTWPAMLLQRVGHGIVMYQGFDSTWRWRTISATGEADGAESAEDLHRCWWNGLLRYLARSRIEEPLPNGATEGGIGENGSRIFVEPAEARPGEWIQLTLRIPDSTRDITLGNNAAVDDVVRLAMVTPSGEVERFTALPRGESAMVGNLEREYVARYRVPDGEPGAYHVRMIRPVSAAEAVFTALPLPYESDRRPADLAAMARAATESGGAFVVARTDARLVFGSPSGEAFLARLPSDSPIRIAETPPWSVRSQWWTVALFLTLLTADLLLERRL